MCSVCFCSDFGTMRKSNDFLEDPKLVIFRPPRRRLSLRITGPRALPKQERNKNESGEKGQAAGIIPRKRNGGIANRVSSEPGGLP